MNPIPTKSVATKSASINPSFESDDWLTSSRDGSTTFSGRHATVSPDRHEGQLTVRLTGMKATFDKRPNKGGMLNRDDDERHNR